MTELQLDTLLEATLFGAGKSMTVSELSESLGYDEDEMFEEFIGFALIGKASIHWVGKFKKFIIPFLTK